ncbi:MAG TPA: FmdB family zinc ribbon protein [Actinomycetota bacterium]|nr:FmdB family zinc ribbon protein [Actinomycetota bacterium]
MPTYEYVCSSCGNRLEVVQRFTDAPLSQCGVCGGPLRKVFHPAGIVFKGSGFYSTDSRGSSKGGSRSSGNGSKGEGGSETSGTSSEGTKEKSA